MAFSFDELAVMPSENLRVSVLTSILTLLAAIIFIWRVRDYFRKSVDVPGIGYGSIPYLGSWQGAIGLTINPRKYVQLGYNRYRGDIFKVPTIQREQIIVCDKEKVQEYLSAPDYVLSIEDALEQDIQGRWNIGYGL